MKKTEIGECVRIGLGPAMGNAGLGKVVRRDHGHQTI